MKNKTLFYGIGLILFFNLFQFHCSKSKHSFQSNWAEGVHRVWVGPEYWANRLQDWKVDSGRLECIFPGANRNVHNLTYQLGPENGEFEVKVKVGFGAVNGEIKNKNWVGFLVGAKGQFVDYRDSAVHGRGLNAGITTEGKLFIGEYQPEVLENMSELDKLLKQGGIELSLKARPIQNKYLLELDAINLSSGQSLAHIQVDTISAEKVIGNVALVSHLPGFSSQNEMVSWFSDWRITGGKCTYNKNQEFGPILFSQYTLSRNILKLTAQMAPVGENGAQTVDMQIQKNGKWEKVGFSEIDSWSRTAAFRLENWDTSKDTPYRLVYQLSVGENRFKEYDWSGTIRKEPFDKEEIVVAGFTGNNDLGFPNNDLVEHVRFHNPDFLFFSGDQIYEGVAGYGVQRTPVDKATLDYLRKWYLYGWAYRDLLKDRPSVAITDDHDVYHGNIWGAGGKATPEGLTGSKAQDMGGYKMPADWVNMVQRTQTSHLPDPFDPTPVEQNIGVYYCDLNYGGISFAVLEDRKFKSPPKVFLPEARVWNGFPQNKNFDAKKSDVPNASLLGQRQLEFLREWSADWSNQAAMKVVLSQTIFACSQTLPENEVNDQNVPKLRILHEGEYPPDDVPVPDMDSNGWPQTGRNKALRELQRCFAFHIAGDQHLGSTIQYGIDDWREGSFAFCVPAISNVWPRRWMPKIGGKNRSQNSPKYTGEFLDGFGNKISVHAVSNPYFTGKEPSRLYDRATGYGIVKLNKTTRDITIECWPRWVDPSPTDAKQYPGWPIKINQSDNFNPANKFFLPTLEVNGLTNPVVQIFNEQKNELMCALRIKGNSFRPFILKDGIYTLKVGEPDENKWQTFSGVSTIAKDDKKVIRVDF